MLVLWYIEIQTQSYNPFSQKQRNSPKAEEFPLHVYDSLPFPQMNTWAEGKGQQLLDLIQVLLMHWC